MEEDDRLFVTDAVRIPRFELNESFSASGGPGGQHANKAATRVELTFDPATSSAFRYETQRARVLERLGTPIRVVVDERGGRGHDAAVRSQIRNRTIAEERLVAKVRGSLRVQATRRATKPSRGAKRRRLESKAQRSELKRQRMRPGIDD